MPKKVSIKCVDGSRFDFVDKDGKVKDIDEFVRRLGECRFFGFPVDNGCKYFNRDNIVSITVKEADDA